MLVQLVPEEAASLLTGTAAGGAPGGPSLAGPSLPPLPALLPAAHGGEEDDAWQGQRGASSPSLPGILFKAAATITGDLVLCEPAGVGTGCLNGVPRALHAGTAGSRPAAGQFV